MLSSLATPPFRDRRSYTLKYKKRRWFRFVMRGVMRGIRMRVPRDFTLLRLRVYRDLVERKGGVRVGGQHWYWGHGRWAFGESGVWEHVCWMRRVCVFLFHQLSSLFYLTVRIADKYEGSWKKRTKRSAKQPRDHESIKYVRWCDLSRGEIREWPNKWSR